MLVKDDAGDGNDTLCHQLPEAVTNAIHTSMDHAVWYELLWTSEYDLRAVWINFGHRMNHNEKMKNSLKSHFTNAKIARVMPSKVFDSTHIFASSTSASLFRDEIIRPSMISLKGDKVTLVKSKWPWSRLTNESKKLVQIQLFTPV